MNFLQSRRTIVTLLAIIVLAGAAIGGYMWWQARQSATAEDEQSVLTQKAVPQSSVPSRFPAGIPLEKDAKILVNLDTTSTDGRFQGTRKFVTKKSITDNAKLYEDFLARDGWTIASRTDLPDLKHFSAKKDDLLIQIVLNESAVPDGDTVEISVQQANPIPGI
jgi:hypothetical protein